MESDAASTNFAFITDTMSMLASFGEPCGHCPSLHCVLRCLATNEFSSQVQFEGILNGTEELQNVRKLPHGPPGINYGAYSASWQELESHKVHFKALKADESVCLYTLADFQTQVEGITDIASSEMLDTSGLESALSVEYSGEKEFVNALSW